MESRKERGGESDRHREVKDREKRISRELSPLDHRGGEVEVEKKSNRRPVSREHSNAGSKNDCRSPCLSGVIYPLISEVSSNYFLLLPNCATKMKLLLFIQS